MVSQLLWTQPIQQVWTRSGRYLLDGRREPRPRASFTSSIVSLVWVSVSAQKQNETNTFRPLVDDSHSATLIDPRLDLLPEGWEMRLTSTSRRHFLDHNTRTVTWDDPRLPSVDANVLEYKRDFRRKLICFCSQPAIRDLDGNMHIKVRRDSIFEDSYAEVMRQSPNDLKKRLLITFEGEPGYDHGGVSRSAAFVHNSWAKEPY